MLLAAAPRRRACPFRSSHPAAPSGRATFSDQSTHSQIMLPLLAVSSTAMAMASKVCVIVGLGNKGIGDACAMKWAKEGFKVAMLARRQETLDELEKSIPGSKAYRCDASQPTEVESTLQAITSDLGPIDVCIYNAGLGLFKRFEDTTFEEFETSVRRPADSTHSLADERPTLLLTLARAHRIWTVAVRSCGPLQRRQGGGARDGGARRRCLRHHGRHRLVAGRPHDARLRRRQDGRARTGAGETATLPDLGLTSA